MFHPSGPNLRRSWMTAWNRHSPNTRRFHSSGLLLPLTYWSVKRLYVRTRLLFRPFGGSSVILTPSCSTETGKSGLGMLVSHSRKSLCTLSGWMPSTMRSRLGIQLTARWQFCRHTHSPRSMPASSSRSALGPCPCPSDTCSNFLEKRISPASLSRSAIGSAPDESTKMSGVAGADSLKHVARSNGGGSMNLAPMCSETNACTALPTLSGRTHRSSASRWNAVSRDANGSASGASCASFESNSARYVGSSSAKW
mmetsp:Transcript_16562/g.49426  ORF Transcript_16562/g.49426 Transcript_16562/m.49426 type:complete len:254 (+) Transcript_16562:1410-2171(+)